MKSKLKTPLFWLLGIVVTAVVTKAVEEYFQWSLLGPLASFLWTGVLSAYEWVSQPVSFPLWFFALSFFSILCVFVVIIRMMGLETRKLKAAEQKIADLQDPKHPRLNDSQRRILQVVVDFTERQRYPNFREIKETLGFSHVVTEGAIDVLRQEGLITWYHNYRGVYEAALTARGRACILHPDFMTELQSVGATR